MVDLRVNEKKSTKTLAVDLGTFSRLDKPEIMNYIKEVCENPETELVLNINNLSKAGLTEIEEDKDMVLMMLKKTVSFSVASETSLLTLQMGSVVQTSRRSRTSFRLFKLQSQ